MFKKLFAILLVALTLVSIFPSVSMAEEPVNIVADGEEDTFEPLTPELRGLSFPSKYYKKTCSKKGKVYTHYLNDNKNRKVYVWVPYKYNKNTNYELVILMHGRGDNEKSWIQTKHKVNNKKMTGQNLFNWMTYDKVCKPFIVVSFNCHDKYFPTLMNDIKDIIKLVSMNYSTYVKGTYSDEDIIAARDHIILGGLSRGSGNTCWFMSENLEYVGNYICMSGTRCYDEIVEKLENSEYGITNYFTACGKNDTKYQPDLIKYYNTIQRYSKNNLCVLYKGAGHDWKTWYSGVYDALKFMIPR